MSQIFQQQKIVVVANNGFPISGILRLDFLTDDGILLETLFNEAGNVILPAEVDPVSGKAETPRESELVVNISEQQMQALKNASKIRISTKFDTDEAKRYDMYNDYSIQFKVITDILYEGKF